MPPLVFLREIPAEYTKIKVTGVEYEPQYHYKT